MKDMHIRQMQFGSLAFALAQAALALGVFWAIEAHIV